MPKESLNKKSKKDLFFVINNLFIFITTTIAVPVTLIIGSRTTRIDGGDIPYWQHIATFTLLSGIFLGLVAGISAFTYIYAKFAKIHIPHKKAINIWYLIATTASMVTCLTVLLYLAPARVIIKGGRYLDLIAEMMFFLHFLNPLLSVFTYIFTTDNIQIIFKTRLLTTLPIVIYAIPYVLCVMVFKIWPDFYGLTFGGRYYLTPVIFFIFILLSLIISTSILKIKNVLQNKFCMIS